MSKFTRWMPLGNYSYGGIDTIVFVRGNKRNGMLKFKSKIVNIVNDSRFVNSILPRDLIDVRENLKAIIEEVNNGVK